MKITNEFVVHTPVERAWKVLTDLEDIAPCMPGAQLTGVEGEVYQGRVKVKVGPVISDFSGTAQFTAKDDEAYRAVIDAKGRDARSAGNAAAIVTAVLVADGPDRTKVSVDTDLKISGKLAQFGSGMIKEVSAKLLTQFVANLEAKLATDSTPAPASSAASSSVAPAAAGVAPGGAGVAPVAAGDVSAAAAETAPATAVALGAVAPAPVQVDEAAAAPIVPDPSAGVVEPAAGRLDTAEGTPDPIAPLNVPAGLATASAAAIISSGSTLAAGAAVAPAAGSSAGVERTVESAEPEPLDLLDIAGTSIYKRFVPVAVGVAVAAAVIIWAVRRR